MKKLFFLGACLVALASSPVKAQTTGPAVAVVISWSSGIGHGHLLIDRGDGKPEQVDYAALNSAKGIANQAAALQQVVSKLYQEGYTLKGTTRGGELIFVKER